METTIDGYKTTVWYESIDFNTPAEVVYNEDLGLSGFSNISKIVQMPIGDVWRSGFTLDPEGITINAPVFKEEYLLGQSFAFKTDVNVEINRGNSAAFEKHFKLGECNTFQDLQEYANSSEFGLEDTQE